jgi:hypothetical protein
MVFCIMIGCGNKSGRDEGVFCRVPVVGEHEGQQEREQTEQRHRLWLKAIARDDITEKKLKYERVCWKHFVNGK